MARAAKPLAEITQDALVNGVLRLGLAETEISAEQRRYQTIPHAMSLRNGYNVDNVQELLSQAEGENCREFLPWRFFAVCTDGNPKSLTQPELSAGCRSDPQH